MIADRSRLLRRQALFWSITALVMALMLWMFRGILLPFVLGMAIAYFLDPLVDWFEKHGFSRLMASILIFFVFIVVLVAIFVVLVPVVIGQVAAFAERLPQYVEGLEAIAVDLRAGPLSFLFAGSDQDFAQDLTALVRDSSSFVAGFVAQLWTSSLAVVNFIALFVVTPVVGFYLLLDWDRMIERIDSWVPRQHVVTVRQLAREVDRSVAGFLRGQGTVCLLLGTYYAVGLSLVGLNFGLLIGLFAGLISFIPYVGSALGLVIALGVALVQFWPDWIWIVATLAVFFSGQFLEGNILQPKLVGASVGLHPVWLMFALFAFGAIFGFVGLLIAVPTAAAIGVLTRFALAKYLESEMYFGRAAEVSTVRQIDNPELSPALHASFDPGAERAE